MAVGFDKHPRGAFNVDPQSLGLGDWYGETGMMLTTQFFGMKIQRYMHDYGITTTRWRASRRRPSATAR